MKPDVSEAQARVLLGLVAVYERDGRATVRTVAARCGRSLQVVHKHLCALDELGLAAFPPDRQGVLRPLVKRVAFGAP